MTSAFVSRRSVNFLVLACSAAILGCGGGGSSSGGVTGPPPPPTTASTTSLKVQNDHYTPSNDSVAVGATLTWTWDTCTGDGYGGSVCSPHSVMFDDGPASVIQETGSFTRTFATAGTYAYHCAVHGTAMSGKITVK